VPKVHIKPIKRPKKDSNTREQSQPKCALVWRTRLSGVPPDSVRCTRDSNSELLTFGNSRGHSAIIHRTVRCASGATTTSAPTVACNSIQCATMRTDVRLAPEGAPDSLQDLFGAPPDCPVPQKTEAPTVRIQRPGDVVGAPDCPVGHQTVRCASGATATSAPTVACNSIQCATVRADVRLAPEGAPDSL
jgi:hypothetical protein